MIGRRRPSKKPTLNKQVCDRFLVPVCNVRFQVEYLNGRQAPWTYRAVQN
jgi:hypothetical protein